MFAAGSELAGKIFKIRMTIDDHIGARETAAVDDGGMVQFVGKNRIALLHQRGDRPDIGHVPCPEDNRRLSSLEAGQVVLQLRVWRLGARRQTRTARSRAPATHALGSRPDHTSIAGKVQVVV